MSLQHPQLGSVKGIQKGVTTQFFGIQYATLAHGLAKPELKEDYGGEIDATKYGPTAVTPGGATGEFGIIQQSLPESPYPGLSKTECLNLNITVPQGAKPGEALPVIVFIHGGAFCLGCNSYPHYDGEKLVTLSTEEGKPAILVTINYRLGVYGFLDTQRLRDAGYPANRGLLDQWTAFKWIRKHIAAFGGDPNGVTAVGQSAGSIAVLLALNSSEELFQHAVALSGNPLMYPILPLFIAEANASKAFAALGLSDLPAEEQIRQLIELSPDDLLAKVPMSIHMGPTIDEASARPAPTYASLAASLKSDLPGTSWCKTLLIGAMDYDAHIFGFLGLFNDRGPIASAFIDRVKKAVTSDRLDALFAIYGLAPTTPDDATQAAVLQFGSDLKYFSTSLAYARAWPGRAYLYQFKEGNPWEGPYKGKAGHVLDVAYLFQNFNQKLTRDQAQTARLFGRDLVVFARGEDPFPVFSNDNGGRVYASGADSTFVPGIHQLGPSEQVQKLWEEIGIQELSGAWDLFLTRQ